MSTVRRDDATFDLWGRPRQRCIDHAQVTATAAHRVATEAFGELAVRKRAGEPVRFDLT